MNAHPPPDMLRVSPLVFALFLFLEGVLPLAVTSSEVSWKDELCGRKLRDIRDEHCPLPIQQRRFGHAISSYLHATPTTKNMRGTGKQQKYYAIQHTKVVGLVVRAVYWYGGVIDDE